MMKEKLVLRDGVVTFDDLLDIKENDNFVNLTSWRGEDLLQISFFNEKYIIDVGWFPAHNIHGHLRIVVVKNQNWNNYLYVVKTKTYNGLIKAINDAVEFIYSVKEHDT